ncbi:hypothetical protein BpHYR1_011998 [Brachionus plicatilis]|uniref:Uncharacterized protein n=1 Tax=Brachionus plicatilis TaxID=10195 RepID=A0A3M7PW91_BRAPC|nr:hypothetical protein BpHYR1_011998 [Brachionus plicatilis]
MDNVSISLPSGFSVKYKNVFYNRNKFPCPACKTHELAVEECLNMTRNRLVLSIKSFELQKKQYEECLKEFEKYQKDPMQLIDFSHYKIKSEIDLRREEVKVLLNKKIDDYYDDLLNKVYIDKFSKLKEFNEKITDLDCAKKQIDSIKIEQNLDYKKNLNVSKFGLTKSIEEIDVKKNFWRALFESRNKF